MIEQEQEWTIDDYKKQVAYLEGKLIKYEEDGISKLYYSLNRKAYEMADILNSIILKNIPLDDPKDKTFDRIRAIIGDSSDVATAVEALGKSLGIIRESKEEKVKKPFVDTIAISR